MPKLSIEDKGKEAAGKEAAQLIKDGMTIGIGTGTTAAFFIKHLAKRVQDGLEIKAVATSERSYDLAAKLGIPMINIAELTHMDIAVDGADEIDPEKQMIKGGGGALLREKIIDSMAEEMVVIVDETKCVKQLGKFPLPVEILPFGYAATLEKLAKKNLKPALRRNAKGAPFVTDNSNYIADLHLNAIENPEELNLALHLIPGVLETGLFINMAGRVVIGHPNGKTTLLE
jgi:ribose 5-phosphate isomerase A